MNVYSNNEFDLQSLTLKQLIDLAESFGIDCSGLETKSQIIQKIKEQAVADKEFQENLHKEDVKEEGMIIYLCRR